MDLTRQARSAILCLIMSPACVITIGKFDGVHLGHRAILATAKQFAQSHDAQVVAIAFDPHPNATLDPDNQPPRLCSTHPARPHQTVR